MKKWQCVLCDYVHEGEEPPEKCPVCSQPREKFIEMKESEPVPEFDVKAMKTATRKLTYGLYVISSRDGEKLNGQVANAVMQVTTSPTTMAVTLIKANYTPECILKSGRFVVNILGQDNHRLIRRFGYRSGREFDKFKGLSYEMTPGDMPYLTDTLGWFECRISPDRVIDCGTHWMFIADVTGGAGLRDDVEPMTYAYYRATKDQR